MYTRYAPALGRAEALEEGHASQVPRRVVPEALRVVAIEPLRLAAGVSDRGGVDLGADGLDPYEEADEEDGDGDLCMTCGWVHVCVGKWMGRESFEMAAINFHRIDQEDAGVQQTSSPPMDRLISPNQQPVGAHTASHIPHTRRLQHVRTSKNVAKGLFRFRSQFFHRTALTCVQKGTAMLPPFVPPLRRLRQAVARPPPCALSALSWCNDDVCMLWCGLKSQSSCLLKTLERRRHRSQAGPGGSCRPCFRSRLEMYARLRRKTKVMVPSQRLHHHKNIPRALRRAGA